MLGSRLEDPAEGGSRLEDPAGEHPAEGGNRLEPPAAAAGVGSLPGLVGPVHQAG